MIPEQLAAQVEIQEVLREENIFNGNIIITLRISAKPGCKLEVPIEGGTAQVQSISFKVIQRR